MRWLALAGALLLAACGQPAMAPSASAKPAPALWKIADKDTTIYLFGTIHLLPKGYDWETPKITAALNGSQSLILEAALDGLPPEAVGAAMHDLATDTPVPPIADRVMTPQRPALDRAIAKAGIQRTELDRMESWAVALMFASAQLEELPARSDYGIESLLSKRFNKAGKPVEGFETIGQQFSYFDTLPPAAQQKFLSSVLEDQGDPRTEYDAMIGAWRAGDLQKIALSFDDEAKLSPELKDALLTQRNMRWTTLIAQRMAKPGSVFVAVGAGHLAGDESVIGMLAAMGFKAERLQ
jgi:uncharacterized protein